MCACVVGMRAVSDSAPAHAWAVPESSFVPAALHVRQPDWTTALTIQISRSLGVVRPRRCAVLISGLLAGNLRIGLRPLLVTNSSPLTVVENLDAPMERIGAASKPHVLFHRGKHKGWSSHGHELGLGRGCRCACALSSSRTRTRSSSSRAASWQTLG